MCGLIFQYSPGTSIESSLIRVRSAINGMSHRGPDDLQVTNVGAAYFAHARLSIIDLSSSRQPMQSADKRYSLVFNGEIYNFVELRQYLSGRWQFQTAGDTEVLLAGLILDGVDFIGRLEGMWAFALWDTHKKELLLSRDRLGKKPLYYSQLGGDITCASELGALREVMSVDWYEDVDSVADYFRYGYCLPGYTMYDQVYEVKPGHYLSWKPGSEVRETHYWSLGQILSSKSHFSNDELSDALHDAVQRRLVADVEVGAFLSGGIDSSLVCSIAQKYSVHSLKTYTVGFSELSFDESGYAARIAEFINSDHHCDIMNTWTPDRLESLIKRNVGQAYADASLLPTAMVCERASRDVKVALSGDGADELFGGYQRYQARILLQWYTRLPKPLRSFASKTLEAFPSPLVHHSRSILKKAQMFVEAAERYSADPHYIAPSLFSQQALSRVIPGLQGKGHIVESLEEETGLSDLQRMLYSDSLVYLPQDILPKVDRASMAAGLEVRSPFLDSKIIEIAFSRSAGQHVRVGMGKRWLREVFGSELPPWVWKRRKQGFGVPLGKWFKEDLGCRLESYLEDTPNTPLDAASVRTMLDKHRGGQVDYGMVLWSIFVYLAARNL